jgi:hypothetical protein
MRGCGSLPVRIVLYLVPRTPLEIDASPEPEAPEPKAKAARISKVQVAEDEIVPKSWRALVARMY